MAIPKLQDFIFNINGDAVKPLIECISEEKIKAKRFSTGFQVFDDSMKGGLKAGDLMIISGVSGYGKTTFAQTLTYNLTKKEVNTLWFSYEVSLEHLHTKFQEMGMEKHYHAFTPEKNTTGKLDWIKDKIKEGWIKYETNVIFIDHIDFLIPTNLKSSDNQSIFLKNIATELKSLAIELDVIIVAMAHLKKIENGREPDMQDIGYSAGVFQLADYVVMVHREKNPNYGSFGGDESGDVFTNNSIIKCVKNRETGQQKFIKANLVNGKLIEAVPEHFKKDPEFFGIKD